MNGIEGKWRNKQTTNEGSWDRKEVTEIRCNEKRVCGIKTMNLMHTISSFDKNCISFLNSKENSIINGIFSNIVYSDANAIFNGIHLKFPINELKLNTNRIKWNYCHFSQLENFKIIESVVRIEHDIIEYYMSYYNINKIPVYTLKNQLKSGYFKTADYTEFNNNYIIKISGIWETNCEIGITSKFEN